MTNKDLANIIFPNINVGIDFYEQKYPKRNLPLEAIVTRYAPSPTGFIHIGALLASFVEKSYARQSNGVFFLRIEDTDTKRTIDNGVNVIIDGLKDFGVTFDEGPISETESIGNYGPYIQSQRADIYHTYIKHLLENGMAYPCFCSVDELTDLRKEQEANKERIGYYGNWAKCRKLTIEEQLNKINNGADYVIRLKAPGKFENKRIFTDEIRGQIEMPENDQDIVIMKSDSLPTYHFAHLVDDHLMRTTHVIRADEWLSSLPIHVQLFEMFGFNVPKFVHISPLLKNDEGSVRKISKRKDPEAAMSYYHELGIPNEAIMRYLATVASSEFEPWFDNNQDKDISDFKFEFTKMNKSGALFDMDKVINIAKNYISKLSAKDLYTRIHTYLEEYDQEFLKIFAKDPLYSTSLLNIEREQAKPRKDIYCYSAVKAEFSYMYEEIYNGVVKTKPFSVINDEKEISLILKTYIDKYFSESDTKEEWFNKIKLLSTELGYAGEVKDFKNNPGMYKAHVGDVSMVLRVAITDRTMTPDLYEIMRLLKKDGLQKRFEPFIK